MRLTKRLDDGQAVMDCKHCELKASQQCTALACRNRLKDRLAEYEDNENTQCKDCVSSGRNRSGVLICQNKLCPCYNREVYPAFSCACGENRAKYVSEGGGTRG